MKPAEKAEEDGKKSISAQQRDHDDCARLWGEGYSPGERELFWLQRVTAL
jgi:hypothetical protein